MDDILREPEVNSAGQHQQAPSSVPVRPIPDLQGLPAPAPSIAVRSLALFRLNVPPGSLSRWISASPSVTERSITPPRYPPLAAAQWAGRLRADLELVMVSGGKRRISSVVRPPELVIPRASDSQLPGITVH